MALKSDQVAKLLMVGAQQGVEDPLVVVPTPDLDDVRKSGEAGIDLRLGSWFLVLRQARLSHIPIKGSASEAQLAKSHFVPFGSPFYVHPQDFVLGITLEWLRMPSDLMGYVVGKSSWGRRGLIIATATGVHPGYAGCLTLELTNVGKLPVEVQPGLRICQLFLHRVERPASSTRAPGSFGGLRKPRIGEVRVDEFAAMLSRADET
ncbi:dCTP deaminase [Candidatus Berkelbacteria bacterium]|nr:dCTP deaminase [Candidatus Berkelbacteria bacterium]